MTSTITEYAHLQIPLQKILDATDNFDDKNIIGKGGFGNVYRGKLEHDGKTLKFAARRLDRKYGQGDVEFWTEVSMLSNLQDTDFIVSMIGFCDEKGEKIIVNKHCPRGSLSMYISSPFFTWKTRLHWAMVVCAAVANIRAGLGSEDIIHRNINSSTILLDKKMCPTLSGFEFSIKHSVERRNQVILSEAIGTQGYIDPAIEKYGGVTHKSDIYALGVVLFELLCERKAFEDNKLLATLAKSHYENGTLKEIIHPDLWTQMDPESFNEFSKIAYSCLQEEPTLRPDVEQLIPPIIIAFEKDNKDLVQNVEDMTKKFEDMPDSSLDIWKVKRWEHFRIWVTNIQDSSPTSDSSISVFVKDQDTFFVKKEMECYDREYVSLVEQNIIDELPKRRYTVAIKGLKYREDVFQMREIGILSSCRHPNILLYV